MTDDRFKGTGEFHPEKAWNRIETENLDRKTGYSSSRGGLAALGLVVSALTVLICAGIFLFGLPQLLRNLF